MIVFINGTFNKALDEKLLFNVLLAVLVNQEDYMYPTFMDWDSFNLKLLSLNLSEEYNIIVIGSSLLKDKIKINPDLYIDSNTFNNHNLFLSSRL